MPRLSKSSVHAALDRAATLILQASGGDAFISRRDIRQMLLVMKSHDRALVQHFYRFIDARDARTGSRVTKKDVEAAVAYTREKILDRYDLNHNGFSQAEIEKMSELGQLVVALAIQLKRAAMEIEINTPEELAGKLAELIEGMNFTGFGSEGEDALEAVHLPTTLDHLDAEALAQALRFDTSTPEHAIARFYPYSPELNFELIDTTQEEMEAALQEHRGETGACYSDESKAYYRVGTALLDHRTVCHSAKEWARDDDGDGIREVHTNTAEGLWTELRNFLRRFKGVSKHFIHLYVAMFEWMHNWKKISPAFMQAIVFRNMSQGVRGEIVRRLGTL